ncbi:TadE/TadG family type IV pilus assembly protein [Vibrio astriarenae]
MQHSLSKQSGHAAILFAMMIPAFFGLFTLGSDGARMMQSKARLGDAMEAASLAVTAHASTNTDTNKQIATNYIEYYAADLKGVNSVSVTRRDCTEEECKAGVDMKFFQYDVITSIKFNSWFPGNEAIVGFGESFDVGAAGRARKYQSHAIDVVLAADFSGSMRKTWDGGNKRRYEDLMDVVSDVATELDNFNKIITSGTNMIGIAPYDHYSRMKIGLDQVNTSTDELIGNFPYSEYCEEYENALRVPRESTHSQANNTHRFHQDYAEKGTTKPNGNGSSGYYDTNIVLARIDHVAKSDAGSINYEQTVASIKSQTFGLSDSEYYDGPIGLRTNKFSFDDDGLDINSYGQNEPSICNKDNTHRAKFYSIGLTSNFSKFTEEVLEFRPDGQGGRGYTASFQGFIEGTRILKSGVNKRKLLILLSDGEDYGTFNVIGSGSSNKVGFDTIADTLVNEHSMCEVIKEYLSELPDSDEEAHVELAVIGFEYEVKDNQALADCVGAENVFKAQDKEEILAQILSLIAEEIGRLK